MPYSRFGQTHQSNWFGCWADRTIYIILCSRKKRHWSNKSPTWPVSKRTFLLFLLAFSFSFHISFWSQLLFRLPLELSFRKLNRAGHPPETQAWNSNQLWSPIVTLMHWLGNFCGMLIPVFQWRCRIPTYCLSLTVSQLVCRFRWRVLRIPRRKQERPDELALANAKSPL